jgi:rhomboid protease GluP
MRLPPEAVELKQACDIVLARMNWSSLQVLCIVDGQMQRGAQFRMRPERVQEIATGCLKYCGSVNFSKRPALVEIVEIASEPMSARDEERLKHLRRASTFSKGHVSACRVDGRTWEVWRNRWQIGRTTVERVLQAPVASEAELRTEIRRRPSSTSPSFPLVTACLIAVLVAVFVLERSLSGGTDPTVVTLTALGGLSGRLVAAGEWWRAMSATVLHGNVGHIVGNAIGLYIAGRVLENMVGRTWFAATYLLAGLSGSLASIMLGMRGVVSVGASGAILGIAAAAVICGLMRRRFEFGQDALRLAVSLALTLGSAIWGGPQAVHIDHMAHMGGALGGAFAAVMMLALWSPSDLLPHGRVFAFVVIGIGCLGFAYAATEVVRTRPSYAVTLMPGSEASADLTTQISHASELVQHYPDDPRAYLVFGVARLQQQDFAGAERALRTALSMEQTLSLYFEPSLALRIRSVLVAALMAHGNRTEAKAEAAPLCALPSKSPLLDTYSQKIWSDVCS